MMLFGFKGVSLDEHFCQQAHYSLAIFGGHNHTSSLYIGCTTGCPEQVRASCPFSSG